MATSIKKATKKTDTLATQNNIVTTDIVVKGARTHNLKNVDISFPRNKFIVVTGVSGSGKSSLTIDTLFAEGQRKYAESLSAYARQFMARMAKPDVDYIKGLCPAIAIEQKVVTRTPRSTVGSMTEIYDYLRLLFARVGKTISPISGSEVIKQDVQDVVIFINSLPIGAKIILLTPLTLTGKRDATEELNILIQKGFARLAITEGTGKKATLATKRIEDLLELPQKELATMLINTLPNTTFIVVDRWVKKEFTEDDIHRISDSINTAFYEGNGELTLEIDQTSRQQFSNKFELDGIKFEEPVPNLFSFNNPFGACPVCEGFSQVLGIDEDLVIPNKALSVYEGAVAAWKGEKMVWWQEQFIANATNFPIHKPIASLLPEQLKILWEGTEKALGINSFFKDVEQNLYKVQYRVLQSRFRGKTNCTSCEGYRLRKEALYVKVYDKHIGELCNMPVKDFKNWLNKIEFTPNETGIAKRILIELHQRLQTLLDVGLGYLTLNRLANSLSGGESQRIQLTRSLGSNLTNSLYILDEPSIGLHSRDTEKLIGVLQSLKALGNTVVVVEHDEMMMREADYIIDMGPLASHLGGEVIAKGNYDEIVGNPLSLTGKYLSKQLQIKAPNVLRKATKTITVNNANHNNLKNITVTFPLGVFCAVSGVSGSGKTTLVKQILYPALKKLKGEYVDKVGNHGSITGSVNTITQIEMVDQNPIGKSSRSNPVTYIKAYDSIRDLYANQPLSKIRGFLPKHFSFNVEGGRCDTCNGEGEQVVEMQFLADVHLTCESCNGKRFKNEVLEVTLNNKNIADVLDMSVDEALDFFGLQAISKSSALALQPLQDVGLGYIKLGQSSNTLSGGEAQRVKLASFLGKNMGHVLFIFDEPTTGLHFNDIQKLLTSFNALVNQGHSLLVIEHNTDVIKCADWLIELGPEAGDEGGSLIFEGVPSDLKKIKASYTGKFL
jgi:excinuclease ABC subunit A